MSPNPAGPLAWAFHSPRRLGTVVGGGLLALVVGVGAVSHAVAPRGADDVRVAAEAQAPTPAPPSADAESPARTDTTVFGPLATDGRAAHVARMFVKNWLEGPTAKTDAAWHAGMRPYVTTELLTGLLRTDRDRVPKAALSPSAPEVRALGEFVDELTVRLHGGRGIDVTVAFDGKRWRVADLDGPARLTDAPSGR